jgi:hypothetical protein
MNNICEKSKSACDEMKADAIKWNDETNLKPHRPVSGGMDDDMMKKLKELGYIR